MVGNVILFKSVFNKLYRVLQKQCKIVKYRSGTQDKIYDIHQYRLGIFCSLRTIQYKISSDGVDVFISRVHWIHLYKQLLLCRYLWNPNTLFHTKMQYLHQLNVRNTTRQLSSDKKTSLFDSFICWQYLDFLS